MNERILVCTHAGDDALGALRLANALTARDGCGVDVLAVVPTVSMEGLTLYTLAYGVVLDDPVSLRRFGDEVRRQLGRVGGAVAAADPAVEVGQVAHTIAEHAARHGHGLIVLGAGRHDVATRVGGGETSLYVSRMARVPVLAVPPDVARVPRSAVVAVDFSDYSRDAARTAARLVGPQGAVRLVHATWMGLAEMRAGGDWLGDYEARSMVRLQELADELRRERGADVHCEVQVGDPVPSILLRGRETEADLLAAGSHGHGFFTRMLLGSTSTRLLRGARCAVLIAPPRGESPELAEARRKRIHLPFPVVEPAPRQVPAT